MLLWETEDIDLQRHCNRLTAWFHLARLRHVPASTRLPKLIAIYTMLVIPPDTPQSIKKHPTRGLLYFWWNLRQAAQSGSIPAENHLVLPKPFNYEVFFPMEEAWKSRKNGQKSLPWWWKRPYGGRNKKLCCRRIIIDLCLVETRQKWHNVHVRIRTLTHTFCSKSWVYSKMIIPIIPQQPNTPFSQKTVKLRSRFLRLPQWLWHWQSTTILKGGENEHCACAGFIIVLPYWNVPIFFFSLVLI